MESRQRLWTPLRLNFATASRNNVFLRVIGRLKPDAQNTNPGYDSNGVLTMQVPVLQTPNPQARAAFMRDLRAQLLALPGVQAVTAATPLPLDGGNSLARWGTEEALSDASKFQQSYVHVVLPGDAHESGRRARIRRERQPA